MQKQQLVTIAAVQQLLHTATAVAAAATVSAAESGDTNTASSDFTDTAYDSTAGDAGTYAACSCTTGRSAY